MCIFETKIETKTKKMVQTEKESLADLCYFLVLLQIVSSFSVSSLVCQKLYSCYNHVKNSLTIYTENHQAETF